MSEMNESGGGDHSGRKRRSALEGILVVDCTQVVAGPYCTRILADLGANVVKVEKPDGGDDVRKGGIMQMGGDSPQFHAANRNKRSLALDLKDPRGKEVFLQLVDQADVVVESFRPGAMEKLGLGYQTLHARNPDLIYCAISGFGQTGPYRDRGGFDLVAQGMSGLMSMTGFKGAPPVKVGVPLCDLSAGMFGAIGILAAIANRDRGGGGQLVDTSLLEAGISLTFTESAYLWAIGQIAEPNGSAHRTRTPYQAVATADGWVVVATGTDVTWERLCEALGRPDIRADERFASNKTRVQNATALIDAMEETMRAQTTSYWVERLNQFGCPAGPIYNIKQVYEDPQVQAREMEVTVQHRTAGLTRQIGFPVKLSETPADIRTAAPLLGEHSAEILREMLGLGPDALSELVESGVVKTADDQLAAI
jgi:crotonobetainyl-CoA:carnitine CoA-transferase CaiB-like acyl-CoA transferase